MFDLSGRTALVTGATGAAGAPGGEAGDAPGAGAPSGDDDVVDAEIVDEDDDKRS